MKRTTPNYQPTGCGSEGGTVYQTQWIILSNDPDWVEIGSGHYCGGNHDHFYGYGINGDFFWMNNIAITPPLTARPFMMNQVSCVYNFYINSALQSGSYADCRRGIRTEVGLESYDAAGDFGWVYYTNIRIKANGGSWVYKNRL
ncbi:MAG: hypothetical protein ACR2K4_05245 [Candidatus Limnocylindria bacterium]